MAVAYQSHNSTQAILATSNSVTITKPTGLAVGDLMIAHIGKTATSATIDTLSGWTSLLNDINGNFRMSVQYKIADSSDVSASDFTFTGSGTTPYTSGAVYRISGQSVSTPLDTNSSLTTWSGTSADLSMGITQSRADNLLLILIGAGSGNQNTTNIASQAIATSNPTWTEDYDISLGTNSIAMICGTHAIRTETTSTGNISFSSSASMNVGLACIISINNTLGVTISPSAITSTAIVNSPTATGGATVSPSAITANGVVNTPTAKQADWSAQGKSTSPTWTSQTKS